MPTKTTKSKSEPSIARPRRQAKAKGPKMRDSKLVQEFAAALVRRKDESGLGLRPFGDKCGISFVYLSELIRGLKAPTLETIETIADGLGIAPAELLKECPSWAA